jgi:Protein of unknown function (DUF3102)
MNRRDPAPTVTGRLAGYADEIRTLEKRANDHVKHAVKHFIEIGNMLITAKKIAGHGNWLPWLEKESDDTARNYMNLANLAASNSERVQNLPAKTL